MSINTPYHKLKAAYRMCKHSVVRKITANAQVVVFRCAACNQFVEVKR